jgi:hypothetical protein
MLVVSVVVLAVVLAGYGFVPEFRSGVQRVGDDVRTMLSTGQRGRGNGGGGLTDSPLRLPAGPANSGCASGVVCLPSGPSGSLGTPVNVCRPGDNC